MTDDPSEANTEYSLNVDCSSVKQMLDDGDEFLLLDCRNPDEFQTVQLEGAQLIPMGELPERVGELEAFRDQRIVVYCHLGGRSLQVTEWLRQLGFNKAQNMAGGIDAWASTIDTTLPRY